MLQGANAATHSSKKRKKALGALGERLVLHFLPPYCPEGNRIERVWSFSLEEPAAPPSRPR
ncbi:transposase [Corallococcus silvisoli]|uniref:transposase n=1 Tax=Corallococcus silvisoli TaxID=2697031 RepID=UPI001F2EB3C8|nr:transposase [Corallococcus silvisoli]